MMLMLLLIELMRLGVHLLATSDGLQVEAPAGTLSDELRQAMRDHKTALQHYAAYPYVETLDGLGMLIGNKHEQDLMFVTRERREAWHYKIGVIGLQDGIERFYWPRMVLLAQPESERRVPNPGSRTYTKWSYARASRTS